MIRRVIIFALLGAVLASWVGCSYYIYYYENQPEKIPVGRFTAVYNDLICHYDPYNDRYVSVYQKPLPADLSPDTLYLCEISLRSDAAALPEDIEFSEARLFFEDDSVAVTLQIDTVFHWNAGGQDIRGVQYRPVMLSGSLPASIRFECIGAVREPEALTPDGEVPLVFEGTMVERKKVYSVDLEKFK